MSKIKVNPEEMIESLRINIMEYDSPRPPVSGVYFHYHSDHPLE